MAHGVTTALVPKFEDPPMSSAEDERPTPRQLQGLVGAERPMSGTEDDDDDRDDERAGENEASVRSISEETEAPEEFDSDAEDDLESDGAEDDSDDDEQEEAEAAIGRPTLVRFPRSFR
jgi:hypothetical protein